MEIEATQGDYRLIKTETRWCLLGPVNDDVLYGLQRDSNFGQGMPASGILDLLMDWFHQSIDGPPDWSCELP